MCQVTCSRAGARGRHPVAAVEHVAPQRLGVEAAGEPALEHVGRVVEGSRSSSASITASVCSGSISGQSEVTRTTTSARNLAAAPGVARQHVVLGAAVDAGRAARPARQRVVVGVGGDRERELVGVARSARGARAGVRASACRPRRPAPCRAAAWRSCGPGRSPRGASGHYAGMVVCTIEARMTSSRLPGKVLMPAAGKPLLELMVERLRRSRALDAIVVATTTTRRRSDRRAGRAARDRRAPRERGRRAGARPGRRAGRRGRPDRRDHGRLPADRPGLVDHVVDGFQQGGADYAPTCSSAPIRAGWTSRSSPPRCSPRSRR